MAELTHEQAVASRAAGNVCIESKAGTGKTTSIVAKAVHLVQHRAVPPERIIVATFTKTAAEECVERIARRVAGGDRATVCTLDKLFRDVCRDNGLAVLHVSQYADRVKDFLDTPDGISFFRSKWSHVIVDEFQDVNKLQMRILQRLVSRAGLELTAVGDPSQNIFGWRDCHSKYLVNIGDYFEVHGKFSLTQNFRSTPEIVALGNCVLSKLGVPEATRMTAHRPSLGKTPRLYVAPKMYRHGHGVAQFIVDLVARSGRPPDDVLILVRSKSLGYLIEEILTRTDSMPFDSALTLDHGDHAASKKKPPPGRIAIMSIHQSKGLERPAVFFALWHPRDQRDDLLREELNLLYVAVTRARDELHIVSPSTAKPAVWQGIPDSAYDLVAEDKEDAERFEKGDRHARAEDDDADPHALVGVTSLIAAMTIDETNDVQRLIESDGGSIQPLPTAQVCALQRQPLAVPTCMRLQTTNMLPELGSFVDRYLSRLVWEHACPDDPRDIRDADCERMFRTLHVGKYLARAWRAHEDMLKDYLDLDARDNADIYESLLSRVQHPADCSALVELVKRMQRHAASHGVAASSIVVVPGRKPFFDRHSRDALEYAKKCYAAYKDPELPTPETKKAAFVVSLAPALMKQRRFRLYDREAYKRFARMLKTVLPACEAFAARFNRRNPSVKVLLRDPRASIYGEADLVDQETSTIYDFKYSCRRSMDPAWRIQLLLYAALRKEASGADTERIAVFNVVYGEIYAEDIRGWSGGQALLDLFRLKRCALQ